MSHFTQMAMHSMYYPIVCFSCLIRILGACSISVDRRPTHCSLWRCDLVFFWLNQSSPMYGYLRCFQSFLIRNCAAIITFKCIHFALEKINMNKIPRVKDVAKWKDMCTWDFPKFFSIEVYWCPFLSAVHENADFPTFSMLSNSMCCLTCWCFPI